MEPRTHQKRTFLITGATRGIGLTTVQRLAESGHQVIGLARNQPDASFPGVFRAVDLADRTSTEVVLREVTSKYHLDGVVNNVGLVRPQLLGEIDLNDLTAVLDVNLRSAVQVTQSALPAMREAGWGRVVNISSIVALGWSNRASYAAAKAGLIAFTRTWALELALTGITVNAVAPGPTETETLRKNYPLGSEAERNYLGVLPMGRFGQPQEIAAAIAFLLSEDASFITGQTLFVDGGVSLGCSIL